MAPDYVFRPMTTSDLPLVRRWLAEPHVVQWWGDPSEQYDLVSGDLDRTRDGPVHRLGRKQRFRLSAVLRPDRRGIRALANIPRGTRGIDQFIGEPDMIDRGHGSAFIRAFVDARLRDGAPRIVTDPDPANTRADSRLREGGL